MDFWLGKVSQEKVRLPLTLNDLLELRDRKIAIRIEICENGAVAFREAKDDFFAAGKIIEEARGNLIKSLEDELSFTASRNHHQAQGSIERRR